MLTHTTTTVEDEVVATFWGVMWTQDVHNTDGSIWRRKDEVEPMPNFSTAKTHLCIYRKNNWPVRLVSSKMVRTKWEVRG